MKFFLCTLYSLLFLLILSSCKGNTQQPKIITISEVELSVDEQTNDTISVDNKGLEIPYMPTGAPQQILLRRSYTSCYNHETRCPNWVAWVLTRESAQGNVEKKIWFDDKGCAMGINGFSQEHVKGSYIYDAEVEEPRPEFSDWDMMPAGASHGHMCPAADCKTSQEAMNQSFLLTNICVQAEKLNTGSWNRLEMSCRDWAIKYGRIFIVTGPMFNNNKVSQRMGNIAIPDGFFKVILCMEGPPKAIGFVFPNNNEKHKREDSICTVDYVEQLTGIDFFTQLSNDIEELIESHADYQAW